MDVDGEIIISLEKVSRHYGELTLSARAYRRQSVQAGAVVHALRDLDLTVMAGERVAVMGPSGSGKSTLLNLICGLDEPTSGCVKFEGLDLSKLGDDERTRLRRERIGMIFQTFNLLPTLSAIENVSLPLRLKGTSQREGERRAGAMLRRVGLSERWRHRPDELSGGERQRIAIARALIFQAPLLLADEPTGNLDSATGEEVLKLLDALHQELNTTILLVTHNELAAGHCERIVTLHDGRVVKDLRTSQGVASASAEVS
jgi:putative ABC transport system ATP-binding protein